MFMHMISSILNPDAICSFSNRTSLLWLSLHDFGVWNIAGLSLTFSCTMSFLREFITRNETFGEILKAEYMCIKRKSLMLICMLVLSANTHHVWLWFNRNHLSNTRSGRDSFV